MDRPELGFVSRGGLKLRAALDHFNIDASGLWCADLGCSTGGFTDCLLQAGAARVFSVDTAYGELAWKLRNDPRVTVMERSNALHTPPHADAAARGGVDLVVIDLGWTPQRLAIPAAAAWLGPGGRIITLIKPHYEMTAAGGPRGRKPVILSDEEAAAMTRRVVNELTAAGYAVPGVVESPVLGGSKGKGNREWLGVVEALEGPIA